MVKDSNGFVEYIDYTDEGCMMYWTVDNSQLIDGFFLVGSGEHTLQSIIYTASIFSLTTRVRQTWFDWFLFIVLKEPILHCTNMVYFLLCLYEPSIYTEIPNWSTPVDILRLLNDKFGGNECKKLSELKHFCDQMGLLS